MSFKHPPQCIRIFFLKSPVTVSDRYLPCVFNFLAFEYVCDSLWAEGEIICTLIQVSTEISLSSPLKEPIAQNQGKWG